MDLSFLMQHATTNIERQMILAVVRRVLAKPAVVVTVKESGRRCRYVMAMEDEQELRRFVGRTHEQIEAELGRLGTGLFWFGARWLRAPGRVDEMHRSLSMAEVVTVEAVDRDLVWGHHASKEG